MKQNDSIVIERTANGFTVREMHRDNVAISSRELLVFNEMGYASGAGDERPCLLTWLEAHFRDSL